MEARSDDKAYDGPIARSRQLRRAATDAEPRLWTHLKARQPGGVRYHDRRTRFLHEQGRTVIRFRNADVVDAVEGVLARIESALAHMPSPNPSRRRQGSLWSPARLRGREA